MMYLKLNNILEDVPLADLLKFERSLFSGGEVNFKLISPPPPEDVTIEILLKSGDDIMALLMATDALRRGGADHISLVCPYIPYSRQDRVMVYGESLSINVMCNIINSQNYKAVYTLDNHSPVTTALIKNCREINDHRILQKVFGERDFVLISPDAGAYKKALGIGYVFGKDVIMASKYRDVSNMHLSATTIYCDDLEGQDCFIIDDLCDGGRTFIGLAEELRTKNCGKLYLYTSHGIYSYGTEKVTDVFDEVFVTNCFYQEHEKRMNVIKIRMEDLL